MAGHRIFTTSFASIYPHYVTKAEKKGRGKAEVDTVITWLTGYSEADLERVIENDTDLATFFAEAPELNPNAELITGVVCGVRVEEIDDELMRRIRQMDKIVDELARGKKIESITRMPRNDPA